jgi:hypothetical protein
MGQNAGEVAVLAKRQHRAFYRVGSECYGTGPTEPTEYTLGQIICTREFPSESRPILDFTVYRAASTDGEGHKTYSIWRGEGFAADAVAKVAFLDLDERVIAEAAVVNNTYKFDSVPAETKPTVIAAYLATGKRVYVSDPPGSH